MVLPGCGSLVYFNQFFFNSFLLTCNMWAWYTDHSAMLRCILLLVNHLLTLCVHFYLFLFTSISILKFALLFLTLWTFCICLNFPFWDCQILSLCNKFLFVLLCFLGQIQDKLSPLAQALLEVIPVGDNLREKHSSLPPHLISPCALLSGWSSSFSGWLCQGLCAGVRHRL